MNLIPQGDLDAIAAEITAGFANATLTAINGPGAPDRNGDVGEGPVVWEGEARGFLARERHDEVVDGQQVRVQRDTFTILEGVAPVVEAAGPDWEASRVTILDERQDAPVELVATVVGLEHTANGMLDSVLLTLDEVGV